MTKGIFSHWQLHNTTTCANLKGQFHIFCSKCQTQNPFTFPQLYWIEERKCMTKALPRAPSFPQVQPHGAQNSQADVPILVSQEYSWPSKLNQRLHTGIKEFWSSFMLCFTAWNDHSLPFSLPLGVLCSWSADSAAWQSCGITNKHVIESRHSVWEKSLHHSPFLNHTNNCWFFKWLKNG